SDVTMKNIAYLIKYTLLPMSIAILATLFSCSKNNDQIDNNAAIAEITDTLRTGNIPKAIQMTEAFKKEALAINDSMKWSEAMVQQGVNAYYQGNPPTVLASADSAISWLERQKPSKERARLLAKAYQTHGAYYDQYYFNPDSSAIYFRKAVDNVEQSGIREDLPQAYSNYANAMRMAANLDSAAFYYHRAITTADSLGLGTEHYVPLYNGIASVLTDMRDFTNSEYWWGKSLEIFESMGQYDKFNTLTGYGNDLYYREDYEGANKVFLRLRKMLDSVPGTEWEKMFTNVNLADSYLRLRDTKQAKELLDSSAYYFSKEQPNPMVTSYIHTLQIREAAANGDYESGIKLAIAYPEADTLRLEQHLARLKAMEELYSNVGNHRLAYKTRCRHDQLNDSLRSYKLNQQISALNARYQRDKRILDLQASNTRQQAHIYKLMAAIAIALAVIVAFTLIFVVRRIRIKRREERMMNKIISLRQENLRNRVTPHFIYNALNHELYNEKNGKPSHLDALVHLIRRQQIIASEILIPFSEELKFTDDYINVIGDNGRDPLDYKYSIEKGINSNVLFPSMTLQILVENAFKHGYPTLEPGTERKLYISVTRYDSNHLSVRVFNNSGRIANFAEKGGTGLHVLVETIRLLNEHNKEQIKFNIDTDSEFDGIKGCNATIIFPDNLKQ
ncbi:MAG: histidine kinase, partial [Muribaculaceae bacterium]|nr:histidine kinase [Muribaculaceae bacterium]